MIMGAHNFDNTLALIAVCLYSALLISAETGIPCTRSAFHEGVGCTRDLDANSSCPDEEFGCRCTYNCSHVKELLAPERAAGRATCIVGGKLYQEGEDFEIPSLNAKPSVVHCTCIRDFPEHDTCPQTQTFVNRVIDRIGEIQMRAGTNREEE